MLLVTVAKGMDLDHYYVGLSGSTGALYFKQSITQWSFQSTTSGFTDLALSTMTSNIKFFGDAIPTGDGALRLTTSGSQAGAVLYNNWIILRTGFKTSFTWSPSNCDTEYNGADGYDTSICFSLRQTRSNFDLSIDLRSLLFLIYRIALSYNLKAQVLEFSMRGATLN